MHDPGDLSADGFATADTFVSDLFTWLNAVRDDHGLPGLAFAVAYTIGQHMNRETRTAFPGLMCLARQVGRDEKNVRNAVRALIDGGHLIVAKRRGGGGSTHYIMPAVKRAKSPAPVHDGSGSERAKSPGPAARAKASERAKSPALMAGEAGAERAKSPEQSGRNRPLNQSQEPTSGESAAPPRSGSGQANGSAVLADRGRAPARPQVVPAVVADGVSDHVDFPIPQHVADESDRRRALERGWRALVGCEPVLADLDAGPLHDAIAAGAVTAEDVTQGIREAMAKPGFRIRAWRQLVGFATTAAKNRMGASPKAVPAFADAEPQRPADAVQVPSGGFRTREQFAEARRRWDDGFTWDEGQFGFPPDSEFTHAPDDLRGPRQRRTAAVDRPADAVQSGAVQSIVSAGDRP